MLQAFTSYRPIFITALVLLLISFMAGSKTVDLHFNDTYYVIAHAQIYTYSAAFLLLAGLICLATNRLLYSVRLSKLHVTLTVTSTLALIILLQLHAYLLKTIPGPDLHTSAMRWADSTMLMITVLFLLMLASQLLLLVNILTGLIKRITISKQSR